MNTLTTSTTVAGVGPWIGLAAVFVLAPLAAWGARRMRLARANIAAGLIVGIVVGPGIFGRLAPELATAIFHGPPELAAEIQRLARERAAVSAVAGRNLGDPDDEKARLDERLARSQERWAAASERHRTPLTTAALVLAGLVMLASGGERRRALVGDWSEAGVLAAWGFFVPVGIVLLWMAEPGVGIGAGPVTSAGLVVAAACAIGGWRIAGIERAIARGIGPAASATASRANFALGVGAAGVASIAFGHALAWPIATAAIVILASYPMGQFVTLPRPLARGAATVALPVLAALAAIRIEPILEFSLWTTLVVYLVAEDGRWFGMALGDRLAGHRSWLGAMRIALVPLAAGPTMTAVAAVGLVTGVLPAPHGFALLVAAALIEVLAPTRLRVARQIEEIERQVAAGEA